MPRHAIDNLHTLDLDEHQLSALRARGFINVSQLYEHTERFPEHITRLLGFGRDHLLGLIKRCGVAVTTGLAQKTLIPQPPGGIAGAIDSNPRLVKWRQAHREWTESITRAVRSLVASAALPLMVNLTDRLPPVKDQGNVGFCVGFGVTAQREFFALEELSNGFTYQGAKTLDGLPNVEGSYQVCGYQFVHQVGAVTPSEYSYQDSLEGRPIEPLFKAAARFKSDGFVDLLPRPGDFEVVPELLKLVLAGQLSEELPAMPVSLSVQMFESSHSAHTQDSGMFIVPYDNERSIGGHAMCIVGYIDAQHPNALGNTTYFIVRNSWGTKWAPNNPLGMPGHALIPAAYLTSQRNTLELLIGLADLVEAGLVNNVQRVLARIIQA